MGNTNYSRRDLETMPEKSFRQIVKNLDYDTDGLDKNQLIGLILEMQGSKEEPEKPIVKAAQDPNSALRGSMHDISTIDLNTLAALRPDLIEQIQALKPTEKLERATETGPQVGLGKFRVRLGAIGPMDIEAYTEPDAVQRFMKNAGIRSFSGASPEVQRVS